MNPNEYQNQIEHLQDLLKELGEIQDKIYACGYRSPVMSDMPRGGNYDSKDTLVDLLDAEAIISADISVVQKRMQWARKEAEIYIAKIQNPHNRLVVRLKYINGMSANQIAEETDRSYWSVIKILKRYM